MNDPDAKKIEPVLNRGGRWVTMGAEQYRIPALGFRSIIDLQERVEALASMGARPTVEQMDTVATIVHAAMKRNYPDITVESVADMLDLENYAEVLDAVLAISGFTKAAAPSGEASASTGMGSTSP
jgi:hypothetical protein